MTLSLPILAAALIAAGCGGGESTAATNVNAVAASGAAAAREDESMMDEQAMKGEEAMKPAGAKVKVVDSDYGRVIANGKGEAFYLFDRERGGKSRCYGACAKAWPPVLTKGKPRAGVGADPGLLGTTRRQDGKLQVTYAGQPLYYYVGDSPGTILCHDVDEFGGTWLVVQASGEPAA